MAGEEQIDHEQREELPLSKAVQYLLEECRMVLPGIQALFGFQLIAVFNPSFAQKLSPAEQRLHLLAIALVVVAVALIMTPAAYHRQTGPREVSETFIHLSSRLLLWSMLPLAASICVDFYLLGRVILDSVWVSLLAAALFAVFLILVVRAPARACHTASCAQAHMNRGCLRAISVAAGSWVRSPKSPYSKNQLRIARTVWIFSRNIPQDYLVLISSRFTDAQKVASLNYRCDSGVY